MPFGFDALVLTILAIPLPLKYRVLPVSGTPYWLFLILFLLLIGFIGISLFPSVFKSQNIREKAKLGFFVGILSISLGGVTLTAIIDRSRTAPVYGVHDIILQQEAAMRYLLQGKNPYKETYFGTPLEQWNYDELGKKAVNPALYHFVMPPWYVLFPFFFYGVSIPMLGFFDGRFMLLFSLVGVVVVLLRWFRKKELGYVAASVVALAPGSVDYFIEGRSDMFALFWFIWSLYLLEKKLWLRSAVIFGLALMSKQTIWFAFPFYLVYLWIQHRKSLLSTVRSLLPVFFIVLFLAGPFLLWDGSAFISSVILYLSGGTQTGYPVSGYGLSMLLYEIGAIKDIHAYYPFVFWQAVLGLPILVWTCRKLRERPSISRLLLGYALTLCVVWYTSRYFNNSHLTYLSGIAALGMLKYWDEGAYEKQ